MVPRSLVLSKVSFPNDLREDITYMAVGKVRMAQSSRAGKRAK